MSLLLFWQAAAGSADINGSVVEGSDAVAGALNHQVSLSGAVLEGSDAVAGTVTVAVSLSGAIAEGSDVATGTVALAVSVSGAVAEGSDAVAGTIETIAAASDISGAVLEGSDSAAGTIAAVHSISGSILESSDAVAGTLDVAVSISGGILEGSDAVSGTIDVVSAGVDISGDFSGGWLIDGGDKVRHPQYLRGTRTLSAAEIRRRRIEFGVLPPDLPEKEEVKAQEAVTQAAQAAVALSKVQPETQAATDALEAQMRAEELFTAVYLAVYPMLEREQILEGLRLEAELYQAEEEQFVMLLATI